MQEEESQTSSKSWLERISTALLGEPQDREQLIELLRDAENRNLLDSDSLRMIEGVLQVSEMRVDEIMIPRENMVVVEKADSLEGVLKVVIDSAHSRFPVIGDSKDDVIGILLAKDLLHFAKTEEEFNIRDVIRPAVFIPESKRLDILLNEFRRNRNHLAIVVDEYGSVTGFVTIEDVLEQIVGDIEDEHDIDEAATIKKHSDNNYSIQATTTIEEFNEYFNTKLKDDEFDTIGGLIMQAFGHLPKRGECIDIRNIHFTVVRANPRRVQLLRVSFNDK